MRHAKFGAIVLVLVGSAAMAQRGGQERPGDERGAAVRERAPIAQRGNADVDRRAQFLHRRGQVAERLNGRRTGRGDSGRGHANRPEGGRIDGPGLQERAGNTRGPARPGPQQSERGVPRELEAFRPGFRRGVEGPRPEPGREGNLRGQRSETRPPQERPSQDRHPEGQRSHGRHFQNHRMNDEGHARRLGGGQVERQGRGVQAGPESGVRRAPASREQEARRAAPFDRAKVLKRRSEGGSNGRL